MTTRTHPTARNRRPLAPPRPGRISSPPMPHTTPDPGGRSNLAAPRAPRFERLAPLILVAVGAWLIIGGMVWAAWILTQN